MLAHAADGIAMWTHWLEEPVATFGVAGAGVAYGVGTLSVWRRHGVGRGVRRWQAWCFALGILTLLVALVSPLDPLAERLFAAHMTQHVLLAVVAPPLLVAGAPFAALWALPASSRRGVVLALKRWHWWANVWRAVTRPAIACALHAAAIWSWHAPRLYEAALAHPVLHALEHASFLGTAVLIWWSVLYPRRSRRTAYAVGLVVLFVTGMQSGALGALLTLSQRVWFPAQAVGSRAWGLTPLEDQQLAGLIMWVPASLLYLVEMSILFVAWMGAGAHGSAARRRIAAAAVAGIGVAGVAGCRPAEASSVPGGSIERGKETIVAMGCGSCHTISGIPGAHGQVGPPLVGIASRSFIAGELPNTPENMMRWLMDPPSIEPRTAMPKLGITEQTARDVVAYLYSRN